MLYLYNPLSRKKEKFVPINDKKVKMYVCGITPYDTTHLGHAFTYVWFDVLFRYLKFKGYQVNYTQNVTDIDDDILRKAKGEKRNWQELGNYWTNKFLNEMRKLNVLPPTHYAKATDSIAKIVEIVKLLIAKNLAYEKNGNVYFEVKKFRNYGKLSGFNRKQMIIISKERGGNPDDPLKKYPLDFLLWQKSKEEEPSWKSPWGKGRPGWHIECSAMINKFLGDQIDIHGGGHDLIFPHHESEIAQSQCFTGKRPFSKFFMHISMVIHQGEKMSKSLGNLVMVSNLLKEYSQNTIRFVLLSHHYRKPWGFEEKELKNAEKLFKEIPKKNAIQKDSGVVPIKSGFPRMPKIMKIFEEHMDDDLNAPEVLQTFQKIPNIMRILGFV